MSHYFELEPSDDPAVRIKLPDGCECVGSVGISTDFFICRHGRRWRLTISRPVVGVDMVEVDQATGRPL